MPLPDGRHIVVALEGYFDESGDFDTDPGLFCVSGYFIASDSAKIMDAEWKRVLDEHEIPYFHMVDCAHGNGVFSEIEEEERIEIVKQFIELIKKYTMEGFSVIAHRDAFAVSDDNPDVYSYSVDSCVRALSTYLEFGRIEGDFACFFESGHKNKGRAYNRIAEKINELSASVKFAKKEKVRLLQAADLLAWQSAKYVKDKFFGNRPPRKDFLSLMEHRHGFSYIAIKDGEKSMGIEAWPLSRRSEISTGFTVNSEGPVTVLFERGDPVPIIPIGKTISYQPTGGRMVKVLVEDYGKNKLNLLFDEPRLFEAALCLMMTMELYAGGDNTPPIPIKQISLGSKGDIPVLRIQIAEQATISFRFSDEIRKRLKELLGVT